MKKALLLLSFVHLLAACTNDIEILPNDESQKLIVNALINANKTNNAIFLALSGYHEPQVVKNGIIHLYINNVLSETISECTYRPNVSIRPRACFFPLFSFLPLWLHYNLNPLCVQY